MARKAIAGNRVLWFRANDLRLDDNTALEAACRDGTSLLPIFVFDPSCFNVVTRYGEARKSSARRARFLLECVASLRRSLEVRGSGLVVGLGSPTEIVPRFAANCAAVFVTEGFCSEEKEEETRVALNILHGELRRVWGGTLYLPNELGGYDPDNIPLGHNEFRGNLRSKGRIREPIPEPSRLPPLPRREDVDASIGISEAFKFLPSLQDLGYSAEESEAAYVDDPRSAMLWEGGEEPARARLQKWMFDDDRLKNYRDTQNGMIGEEFSSKLSPWLARGCISVRRIRSELRRYEVERTQNHGTYWFHNLLEWRERMIYIARSQGDKIFKLGGISGYQSSWSWQGTKEDLQSWKDGRTGEELVDAGMKELMLTGYMSMRARHIVASYLIYEFGVDWRHGAAHFEEHLLDYDPALNWIMWMLQTGVLGRSGRSLGLSHFDAKKPYASQRKQLSKYAPDREYIQRWLLESRSVVVVSSSSHKAGLQKQFPNDHRGGSAVTWSWREDNDEESVTKAKHQGWREPVQLSRFVGKGKGRHWRGEYEGERSADAQKKRRWGKKADSTSYYETALVAA